MCVMRWGVSGCNVCVCLGRAVMVERQEALALLRLVGRFALLLLDHAAAYNAVEAAQVEECDGAEQPHGHNLNPEHSCL